MKKPPYEKEALKRGIERCLKTIQSFEEAIEKEKVAMEKLKGYIYDIEVYEKWQ